MTLISLNNYGRIIAFRYVTRLNVRSRPKKTGEEVSWRDVPAAAQATMQQNAGGAKVARITNQTKNGTLIYSAEVKERDGKLNRVVVTDAGKLLGVKEEKSKHKHRPLFGG